MPENDVIDFLRAQFARVNQRLGAIAHSQNEHGHRFSRIEVAVASLRRDQPIDAEAAATQSDRIERRLDLAEAPAA